MVEKSFLLKKTIIGYKYFFFLFLSFLITFCVEERVIEKRMKFLLWFHITIHSYLITIGSFICVHLLKRMQIRSTKKKVFFLFFTFSLLSNYYTNDKSKRKTWWFNLHEVSKSYEVDFFSNRDTRLFVNYYCTFFEWKDRHLFTSDNRLVICLAEGYVRSNQLVWSF